MRIQIPITFLSCILITYHGMVAAATLTDICKEQTIQATCKTTAGCGWSSTSGTCSQCSTGQFSTNNDTYCMDCENAPTGSQPIYTNQAGWNNINCPWDAICPRGTVPEPYDIPTECRRHLYIRWFLSEI